MAVQPWQFESITNSVSVPPDEVTIEGEVEVKADRTYTYRCEARNANPAPAIQWIGDFLFIKVTIS